MSWADVQLLWQQVWHFVMPGPDGLSASAYQRASQLIFLGVLGILLLASAVGKLLGRIHTSPKKRAVIANYNSRVRLWWWMAAILSLAFWLGKPGMTVLFGFLSFYALREFISLQYTRRSDHWSIAAGFYLILPLQYALIWLEKYDLYTLVIPVYAFLFLPMLSALHADTTRFLERSSKVQWGLMISIYCVSHVPALLALPIPGYEGRHLLLIAFLVLVVQSSDMAQYFVGKLTRGLPLMRRLVPEMTRKTLAAGLLSAALTGLLLWWMTPFQVWQAPLIAALLAAIGMLGNLLMAAIKRDRGIADWGETIVGYGSMLDKMESVIFAAPIYFHIIHAYWALA